MEAGKLSTPIWEFEGGKAYDTEGNAYHYSVNDSVLSITAGNTVYTYTVSADKETLTDGKKTTGNSDPVAVEPSSLTRNLAGRTYKYLAEDYPTIILNIKTAGAYDLQKNASHFGEDDKYEINEEGIITFPYGPLGKAIYTVSPDKKTLTPTEECDSGYQYVLTLVTDAAAE